MRIERRASFPLKAVEPEKYYSPAERQTYLAALPPGYAGQFGPGIKALALVQ